MSAKLPTKEEELCHLENRLKNKKYFPLQNKKLYMQFKNAYL